MSSLAPQHLLISSRIVIQTIQRIDLSLIQSITLLQNHNQIFLSQINHTFSYPFIIYFAQKDYLNINIMGFTYSKQQLALVEAKKIKENLLERVRNYKRNYSAAFSQISPQLKKQILASSAIEISDMIDSQVATTTQVVYTFIERTINVGVINNYVLDEMFEEAVHQAIICDRQRKEDGYEKKSWRPGMDQSKCYPPFYGVPTSVKQTMIMKGRQTHVGFVSKVNPLVDHDGLFVIMIRRMGFIPIARSNVPQGCKTIETNNNIFGYSKNPWNLERSCGGSSGGQSGMVASYSAPIGFGSDIGGSLRIPAAFTGLVALKPHNRYSRQGNCYYGKFSGGIPIKSQLGPITRTVDDTILVLNYLSNPQNYKDIPMQDLDPFQKYTALDMQKINKPQKFKIGVVRRLKYAKSSKANERALQTSIQILKSKGHQLVDINFDKLEKLYFCFVNLFIFDQKMHLFSEFKGSEPLTVEFKLFTLLAKIPWFLKKIIIWFIARKQPRLVQMLKTSKPMSGVKVLQKIHDIQKIQCAQIYKIFALNKLDAVILPTFVTPAPKLGEAGKLQYFFSFTAAWNVLHYPAATIPVTVMREDEKDFKDQFNDFYTKNVQNQLKDAQGLPVGVQIASTPYNEQKILYIMKQLEGQIKFRKNHQIPQ